MLRARYRRIIIFFSIILLSIIVWDVILPRIGLAGWAHRTRSKRYKKIAAKYRSLAIQMGGVLIKVGQFLSARVDILPVEVIDELSGLQDEVPPEDFDGIRIVAEAELGASLQDKFIEFDPLPLAAASLGQAHLAKIRLKGEQLNSILGQNNYPPGEIVDYPVVVKVQRPNIENIILTDLAAVRTVGNWVKRYPPIRKRANVPALIAEFTRVLFEEIDYIHEGKNAETFATNFSGSPLVLVPKVIWSHTTKRVLTLEDVRGIKITDYEEITNAGIDRSQVASRLCDTYLKQIFEDGFFHADPHPGNLFVKPMVTSNGGKLTEDQWKLTFIDFGMVGHMKPEMRDGLRELLVGVGLQEPERVIKAYQILGILLPGADVSLLERAEAEMFKRFWGKDMTELTTISLDEIHDMAYEFREILYQLPFQLPQDLIFLGRAIGILSGMCTGLDPKLNVFEHIGPYSQKIMAEEVTHDWDYWMSEVGNIAKKVILLPIRVDALITKLERGEINVHDSKLSENINKLEVAVTKAVIGLIFTAFLLSSVQLFSIHEVVFGWILGVLSAISFLWLLISHY